MAESIGPNVVSKFIMDTHLHSKASDGFWSPREVVINAKARGLEVIALTDHDTTYGIIEAMDEAKKRDIVLIPGIELDAKYDVEDLNKYGLSNSVAVKDIEVLGLGIDVEKIDWLVKEIAISRNGAINDYIAKFNDYIDSDNYSESNESKVHKFNNPQHFSLDNVIEWYNKNNLDQEGNPYNNPYPFLSKILLLKYIADRFVNEDQKILISKKNDRKTMDAFKNEYNFIVTPNKDLKIFYKKAIDGIIGAGGIPVLAHPGLSKGYKNGMVKGWDLDDSEGFSIVPGKFTSFNFISDLKDLGLKGIEIYNYYDADKTSLETQNKINNYFIKVAERLDLITTYGSDCHGPKDNDRIYMGTFGSKNLYLNDLVKKYSSNSV